MTDEELTRAVAERVMGWHQDYGSNPGTPPIWLTSKNEVTGFYVSCKSVYKAGWSKNIQDLMWNPLTDLNHAWMVVESICSKLKCDFELRKNYAAEAISWYSAYFNDPFNGIFLGNCRGKAPGGAILEAALEAVRGSDDTKTQS